MARLPAPPPGAFHLTLTFAQLNEQYELGFWMYAPLWEEDQAAAIAWLESSAHPYFTSFVTQLLSQYTFLIAYRSESFGPAGWVVEEPVTPVAGDRSSSQVNAVCLSTVLRGIGNSRGGHSVQHWPGVPIEASDNGQEWAEDYFSLARALAGDLFNSALAPGAASAGGYVATLSRVSGGSPRESALLLPASSFGPSWRVGILRRRIRT